MICNELWRIMGWVKEAIVYLEEYRDSLIFSGKDSDDGLAIDNIRELLWEATDNRWIDDWETRQKEEKL